MCNPIETTITPAALLTAAREGKITASVIDAETLPPLAGGDGPEQYPTSTIALQIEQPNLTSITSLPGVTGASVKGEREICVEYMTSAAGPLLPILPGTIIDGSNNAGELSDVVIRLGKDIPTAPITLRTLTAWKLVYYSTDGDTMNSGRGTYDFRAIESDGCTRGDATVQLNGDGDAFTRIEIETGEGCTSPDDIDVTGLAEEEQEEILEAIRDAIDDAYTEWTPEHPDESEIYQALVSKRRETTTIDAALGVNLDGEIRVKLYAGTHCGQPQFAVEGDEDETVYDDAEEAAKAGREKLEALLQAVIDDKNGKLDKQEREAAEALEASLKED